MTKISFACSKFAYFYALIKLPEACGRSSFLVDRIWRWPLDESLI